MSGEKSTSQVIELLQNKSDYFTRLTIMEQKRLDDINEALKYIEEQKETFRKHTKEEAIEVMNAAAFTGTKGTKSRNLFQRADGANISKEASQVILGAIFFTR